MGTIGVGVCRVGSALDARGERGEATTVDAMGMEVAIRLNRLELDPSAGGFNHQSESEPPSQPYHGTGIYR